MYKYKNLWLMAVILTVAVHSNAAPLDQEGPPPADDVSAYRDAIVGEKASRDLEADPYGVIGGALEGGPTGKAYDQSVYNVRPEATLGGNGGYDVPTGSIPSPLFGAKPFTQKMLRFEEFGPQILDPSVEGQVKQLPLPQSVNGASPLVGIPDGPELDTLIAEQGFSPFPTEQANVYEPNPWAPLIEQYLGRAVNNAPVEGRPPGEAWAHQRWNEFYPASGFKTIQTGSRLNTGFRDGLQTHGYSQGEFAPGGLYHEVADGLPGGTTAGIRAQFHPAMPVQEPTSLWTFDGTLPPKLLKVRYGEPVLMRHYNGLPVDVTANRGFGMHTITTHEHNGHNPAESDGVASAFFYPGQFYDYRWPIALAGHDSINTTADEPRAAAPCVAGETLYVHDEAPGWKQCDENGRIQIRGDWRETMSTHWFHDHMLDFTAPNVYKGNEAMMNYYSALDRGNECHDDGVNLRFPSGCAAGENSWGNRDYDVNFFLGDKAWDAQGQLWFNVFNKDGFLGDQMVVNWVYKPYLDVRARKYRFRILNGSVSRYFKIELVHEVKGHKRGEIRGRKKQGVSWNRVPFHMIANDGNILEHAVAFDGTRDLDGDGDAKEHRGALPMLAIAERYDIVVDFSKHGIKPGDKLFFVNTSEHKNGKKVEGSVPLADVLRGKYRAKIRKGRWKGGDPIVGKFMELRVHAYDGEDLSMDPAEYVAGAKKMIPLKFDRDNQAHMATLSEARHRTFKFGRSSGTDEKPWTVKVDGEAAYTGDTRRISAAPQLTHGPTEGGFAGDGTAEVWTIETGGGWSHPIHIHFEEGIILRQDGEAPPEWNKWARKDVFRIGPEEDAARDMDIYYNFREFAGTYVEHCHNTQHEDHAMLLRWDLEHPGQVKVMPSPIPTWDGVKYADSVALPTFRSGDGFGLND